MILVILFFVVTPITLLASTVSLYAMENSKVAQTTIVAPSASVSGVRVYASLPSSAGKIEQKPTPADARPIIVKNYLDRYGSVLSAHSELIVTEADKNQIDWRLIPAIAQQESNVCKRIPPDSFNCWGWGIHAKGTLGFTSYEEGIKTVSRGLGKEYIAKGYITPEKIMSKYTPSSDGSWARGVTQFMGEMN